jgi:hypothetical protein
LKYILFLLSTADNANDSANFYVWPFDFSHSLLSLPDFEYIYTLINPILVCVYLQESILIIELRMWNLLTFVESIECHSCSIYAVQSE